MKKYILLSIIAAGFTVSVFAQNYVVSGVVRDSISGEAMVGVNIVADNSNRGTSTDTDGRYSLSLTKGQHSLDVSFVGYSTINKTVTVAVNMTLDFRLVSNTFIEEVIVQSRRADSSVRDITMGTERMSVAEVRKLPALMGEVDILKAIVLLPGVQTTSEGSSGFSVRGGSSDQNLILLDNTPVYNASHLMGFFSVFNNDAIGGLELYKGDMPLKYGGRISSLLDVKSRNEIPERFSGTGGIGIISSRIMLEAPITKNLNWMVAGRRSYADMFLIFSPNPVLRQTKIYFYDLNGKLTWRINPHNILETTAYMGNDTFGADMGAFTYGNKAAALTWKHFFNDDIQLNSSFNFTNYGYEVGGAIDTMSLTWSADIKDFSLRTDADHKLNDSWKLTYGASTTYHAINPGKIVTSILAPTYLPTTDAWETALYVQSEQKLWELLSVKYGIRGVLFHNGEEKPFYAAEPRLGGVFMVSPASSVKASYALNSQYIQVANNSASGSPMDVWFPVSDRIAPQSAHIWSLGYFQNFRDNSWEFSIEGYYKALRNVIDFKDNAQLFGNEDLENEILTGSGRAYGIEVQIKRSVGVVTGFVNYTISRSERTVDGINDGQTYLAPFDKTHSLNIVLNWEINRHINVSLTWLYSTGIPTTLPTGRFEIDGEFFPIYSARNEYRYPDYHRLDIGVEWTPRWNANRRWKGSWNFSIYNVYNQKNPWMIGYKQNVQTGIPYGEMTYLFGIVPSITYNFRF